MVMAYISQTPFSDLLCQDAAYTTNINLSADEEEESESNVGNEVPCVCSITNKELYVVLQATIMYLSFVYYGKIFLFSFNSPPPQLMNPILFPYYYFYLFYPQ